MEKKHLIGKILIVLLIASIIASAGVIIELKGIKSNNTHYVQLEVNPRIEILTNRKNKVTSVLPLNEEAREIMVEENFIGLSIEDATEKFMTLCTQCGYIDVNSEDNAVRTTIVSGLTQSLEVKVYSTINNFFLKNEIMGVIVENDSDLAQIKEAKKLGVSSANKLAIIKSMIEKNPELSVDDLKKIDESKLIKKIEDYHETCSYNSSVYTKEQIANKSKLIDFNRQNYTNHKNAITESSLEQFSEEYEAFRRENLKKYEEGFSEQYNLWLQNN